MNNWLNRKGYYQGVFFSILFLSLGPALDAVTKYLSSNLHQLEIIFFRFFFSLISLVLYMVIRNSFKVKTKYLKLNIIRGVLGYISFIGCVYSVTMLSLAEITIIFWTMPFFILILSSIILKEKVNINRWIATIIGFCGLYFFVCPGGVSLRVAALIPIGSAFCFALQDILIKRMVEHDSKISMMFYFGLVTTSLSFIPALLVWSSPTIHDIILLSILGIGANLMQYFIFKAFSAADVSALAPFRYIEFIIAALFDLTIFGVIPTLHTYLGAVIIIPTTLYLVYSEVSKKSKNKSKNINKRSSVIQENPQN